MPTNTKKPNGKPAGKAPPYPIRHNNPIPQPTMVLKEGVIIDPRRKEVKNG